MRRKHYVFSVLLIALIGCPQLLFGQRPLRDPRTVKERLIYFPIDDTLKTVLDPTKTPSAKNTAIGELCDVLDVHAFAFVHYAIPPSALLDSFKDFLLSVEKTRVDKQTGASPSASGSTSAAARTGLSELFAFALESGAISQTVDQSVATLRANADGLIRFLSNQDVFPACAENDPSCPRPGPLKNVELSAAFNVGDGGTKTLNGTTPATGSAVDFSTVVNRHQFASATARYAVDKMDKRDLRSPEYRKRWLEWFQKNSSALRAAGANLLQIAKAALDKVETTDANGDPTSKSGRTDQFTLWRTETQTRLSSAPRVKEEWENVFHQQLDILLEKMRALDPEFNSRLTELAKEYARYLALRRDLSSMLIVDPALTLEYTYSEPRLQPKLHTVRVAYAYSPKGTPGAANPGTITFNAALDYYKDPQPVGTGLDTARWKDAQVAVQFDRPLGLPDAAAQLSVGAYYQYQRNRGVIEIPAGATMLPGTNIVLPPSGSPLLAAPGSIYAAQAVLTIRLTGSGMKVPIGISWSNRTELATGNEVRGHVGFTFDTSPLFLIPGFR